MYHISYYQIHWFLTVYHSSHNQILLFLTVYHSSHNQIHWFLRVYHRSHNQINWFLPHWFADIPIYIPFLSPIFSTFFLLSLLRRLHPDYSTVAASLNWRDSVKRRGLQLPLVLYNLPPPKQTFTLTCIQPPPTTQSLYCKFSILTDTWGPWMKTRLYWPYSNCPLAYSITKYSVMIFFKLSTSIYKIIHF